MTDIEITNYIKDTYENHKLTYTMILFSKKNKEVANWILNRTKFLDQVPKLTKRTRIHCILNNITELPKCKICGKVLYRNAKPGVGFARYCCPKCENSDPEVIQKLKETNNKIYGCDWSFQSDNNKNKTKITMNKKYGCDYAMQNQEIHDKAIKRMIEIFGVPYPSKSKEIEYKKKIKSITKLYKKLSSNNKVQPLFTLQELIDNGKYIRYRWKCLKCGTEFESFIDVSWYRQGWNKSYARCTSCYPRESGISSGEKDVLKYILSFYKGDYLENKRCLKINENSHGNLEIDLLFPNVNIGIEYDGLFWHSEQSGTPNDYHLMKTNTALKNNINLIHIFESEWRDRNEAVKSYIKYVFGMTTKINLDSKKYIIRSLSYDESKLFFDQNSILGHVKSNNTFGLELNDEIVCAMTFNRCRFMNIENTFEISRLATKNGFIVENGYKLLLDHFTKTHTTANIIGYSDRRYPINKIFEELSFNHFKTTKPSYYYIIKGKLKSRHEYTKNTLKDKLKIFDETKSEVQNMIDNGYSRIFDCGTDVYIYHNQ